MINWKTNLAAVLGSIGASMQLAESTAVEAIGFIVIGIAMLFGFGSARDSNVTSEQSGAN